MIPPEAMRALAWSVLVLAVGIGSPAFGERRDILLVGDSIGVSGTVDRSKEGLQGRLERKRPGWFIANVSRGGMSVGAGGPWPPFNTVLLGIDGVMRRNVIVSLGVNDYLTSIPLDDFRTSYEQIANTAAFWGENLICVTPIWEGGEEEPNGAGAVLEEYRQVIGEVCIAHGFVVIDGLQLVPHDPAMYAENGSGFLHPNRRGYAWFARRLAPLLDDVLQ